MKKIIIQSLSISIIVCLVNFMLFWLTDEIDFIYRWSDSIWVDMVLLLPLMISPTILIVVSSIIGILKKKKKIWDNAQRNEFWILTDIFCLFLEIILLPILCAHFEVGMAWDTGLYLAVIRWLTMIVTAIHLFVVIILMNSHMIFDRHGSKG